MNALFRNVCIKHIAASVPKNIENNSDVSFEEKSKRKAIKATGVNSKRIVKGGESLLEYYKRSAMQTLEALNWSVDEIDGLIVVAQTHEYKLPATACVLHEALNLRKDTFGYDISLGCSGYVYGLYSAMSALESQQGRIRKILLFAGDAISTLVDKDDRSTRFLFGDAATCTALEYVESCSESFFVLKTDGSGYRDIILEGGGLKLSNRLLMEGNSSGDVGKFYLRMNGQKVFDFTLREVPALIDDLCQFSKSTREEIEVYCFHQANKVILEFISSKCEISHKSPINIEDFGNTSCASIPLLISDKSAQCTVEKAALIGFGVGWSMAACLINLKSISTSLDLGTECL